MRIRDWSSVVCSPDLGFYLLGDSEPVMLDWLRNLFGETKPPRRTTEAALLLWLDQPLLPREYPRTAADVLALARMVGPEAAAQLERIAVDQPEKIVVALGSATSNGHCLAGLTLAAPRTDRKSTRLNSSHQCESRMPSSA